MDSNSRENSDMGKLGTACEADFRARAAACLEPGPSRYIFEPRSAGAVRADRLDEDPEIARELFSDRQLRDAAVLVPVVARSALTVLFTQRTTHLPSHAGQIAFPGGKMEACDANPLAAALREAGEEIGLDARFVEPLGYLDTVRTRTGFNITPVVGLVRPGFQLDIDYSEVVEAFEVPLEFLMDPVNHQRLESSVNGEARHFYAVPFARRYIWGITAGIIKNMSVRLSADRKSGD